MGCSCPPGKGEWCKEGGSAEDRAAGLSPAQPQSSALLCHFPAALLSLTCPQGWVTLSRAVGRIPQPILFGALKITSAEGEKKRWCLKWKCSRCCGSVLSPFRKVHSEVPSKAAVLQQQRKKEQLQGRGGSQAPPPGGAICSGKDKNANPKSIHLSPECSGHL